MSTSKLIVNSVKERVLLTVHKLGRSASRSLVFRARISTDETVSVALEGLVRDRLLSIDAAELCQVTELGYSALEHDPRLDPLPPPAAVSRKPGAGEKCCRTCGHPKPLEKFDRANRSADHRTADCTDCRTKQKGGQPDEGASSPVVEQLAQVGPTDLQSQQPRPAESAGRPPILAIPTELGVYAKVEAGRVYISQPLTGGESSVRLTLARALELGHFLVAHCKEPAPQ